MSHAEMQQLQSEFVAVGSECAQRGVGGCLRWRKRRLGSFFCELSLPKCLRFFVSPLHYRVPAWTHWQASLFYRWTIAGAVTFDGHAPGGTTLRINRMATSSLPL